MGPAPARGDRWVVTVEYELDLSDYQLGIPPLLVQVQCVSSKPSQSRARTEIASDGPPLEDFSLVDDAEEPEETLLQSLPLFTYVHESERSELAEYLGRGTLVPVFGSPPTAWETLSAHLRGLGVSGGLLATVPSHGTLGSVIVFGLSQMIYVKILDQGVIVPAGEGIKGLSEAYWSDLKLRLEAKLAQRRVERARQEAAIKLEQDAAAKLERDAERKRQRDLHDGGYYGSGL